MKTFANNHTLEQEREAGPAAFAENLRQSNLALHTDEEKEALKAFLMDFAAEQAKFDTESDFEWPRAS